MRPAVILVLLLPLAVPASVPHPPMVYVSGSAAVPNGTAGSLNLSDEKDLQFDYAEDTWRVPYRRITALEFASKPGAKAHLASGMSWVPKFGKKQGKLMTILYKNADGAGEAAVFEIRNEEFDAVAGLLESRTGKRVRYDRDEQAQTETAQAPQVESSLVPVTFVSTPRGATVFMWGQAAGRTPVTQKLAPGTYTIEMTYGDLPAWKREIEVGVGKPMTVTADLAQPQPNTVVVTRAP